MMSLLLRGCRWTAPSAPFILLALLLSSCAGPARVTQSCTEPASFNGSSGRGCASWYGAELAGHATANGERFDPNGFTAAHRTLAFNTRVRVTNLQNGRSVTVRINDRGPFQSNRVLDLSSAAADVLGMKPKGVVAVSYEIVSY